MYSTADATPKAVPISLSAALSSLTPSPCSICSSMPGWSVHSALRAPADPTEGAELATGHRRAVGHAGCRHGHHRACRRSALPRLDRPVRVLGSGRASYRWRRPECLARKPSGVVKQRWLTGTYRDGLLGGATTKRRMYLSCIRSLTGEWPSSVAASRTSASSNGPGRFPTETAPTTPALISRTTT